MCPRSHLRADRVNKNTGFMTRTQIFSCEFSGSAKVNVSKILQNFGHLRKSIYVREIIKKSLHFYFFSLYLDDVIQVKGVIFSVTKSIRKSKVI